MPFIQQAKPEQQKTFVFNIDNYDSGLNNVKSPFIMNDNESPDILNMMCFEQGSLETRPGLIKYINEIFPATVDAMFLFETTTFSYLILSCGTNLYKFNLATNTATLITTIANTISGFQQENLFFFVDGAKYREYDGTNVYEILDTVCVSGIAQAGGANTITLASTDTAIEDAYNTYIIKIVSGTGINQVRTISDYVTATKIATISVNWDINPDVTSIYYITKTAQGITSTITTTKIYSPTYDEFINTYKGDSNIDDIKLCRRILFHKQRIWFTNHTTYQNNMYYTDIANPYYVPVSQWQPIISNDNDAILGIISFNDVLVVFKESTINALYGFDYTDFDLKEVTVSCGTASINTVCKADNYLLYLGSNGRIYSMYDLRTDVKKIATKDISFDRIDIQRQPINAHSDVWSTAKAIFFDRYYILFVGDKTIVYDKIGWFLWDNINPTSMIKYENTLLLTDSSKYLFRLPFSPYRATERWVATEGQTLFNLTLSYLNEYQDAVVEVDGVVTTFDKMSNTQIKVNDTISAGSIVTLEHLSMIGYNDNNELYLAKWESKDFDLNVPTKLKQIKQFNVTANTYKYFTSNVNVHILVDFNQIDTNIVIKNQISLFGLAVFGDKFIINNVVDSSRIRISKRGRIFRFKLFTDTINTPFKIYTIYGEYFVKNRGV